MKGLQVTIGLALLPVFQELIGIMQPLADLAKEHASLFLILGGTIAALAAAVLIVNAAMAVAEAATAAWAAAQWILNAAMAANPVGLIVIAVAALAAGIILAYRHSATFRAIVGGAFDACKKAGQLMLAPIQSFIGLLQSAWGYAKQFGGIASSAFRIVREYGVLMLGPLGLWIKLIQTAWQHSATFRSITVAAFDAVKSAIQAVIDAISSVIGAIGRIHFPSKPGWLPLSAPSGYSVPAPYMGPGLTAETGSGMVVHVSVSGAVDPEATAIQIRRILERYDRRRGRRPLGGET
jgi:phage-related protein